MRRPLTQPRDFRVHRAVSAQLSAAPEWKEMASLAEQHAGPEVGVESLLKSLACAKVPARATAWGVVHYEIAQLYAEGQCAKGGKVFGRRMVDAMAGIYHMRMAARGGVTLACLQLWRMHANLRPVSGIMAPSGCRLHAPNGRVSALQPFL